MCLKKLPLTSLKFAGVVIAILLLLFLFVFAMMIIPFYITFIFVIHAPEFSLNYAPTIFGGVRQIN